MSAECGGDCSIQNQICEVTVLDEAWAKKRSLQDGSARCAAREPNAPLAFIGWQY